MRCVWRDGEGDALCTGSEALDAIMEGLVH